MPLSPHLSVYRVQLTSLLSIFHRFSELGLYGIAFISAGLLGGCCFWPEAIDFMANHLPWAVGCAIGGGISVILSFHLLSSLRYLGWDLGLGFSLPHLHLTGWLVLLLFLPLALAPYGIEFLHHRPDRLLMGKGKGA